MKTYINLLPRGYRLSKLLWQRLGQWSAIWAAGAVIGMGLSVQAYNRYDQGSHGFHSRERRYAPVARLQTEIGDLEAQVKELAAREKSLEWLGADRPALALLGLVSGSAAQCAGQVTVEKLSLKPLGEPGVAPVSPANPSHALTLQGVGLDNLAVARFVVALRETSAFEAVDLKSTVKQGPEGKQTCQYVVECVF